MAFWPKRRGDVADTDPGAAARAQTAPGPITGAGQRPDMPQPRGPVPVPVPVARPAPAPGDQLAHDLMVRVGRAIDEWAADNELGAIPHSILFEQALSILNAFDRTAARPWAGRT